MLTLKKDDCEFILLASKFCDKIEWYIDILDLNHEVLYAFKSQNMIINHLVESNDLWNKELKEFFADTLDNLKVAYNYLTLLCKCSPYYNNDVGSDLGIETSDTPYAFSAN